MGGCVSQNKKTKSIAPISVPIPSAQIAIPTVKGQSPNIVGEHSKIISVTSNGNNKVQQTQFINIPLNSNSLTKENNFISSNIQQKHKIINMNIQPQNNIIKPNNINETQSILHRLPQVTSIIPTLSQQLNQQIFVPNNIKQIVSKQVFIPNIQRPVSPYFRPVSPYQRPISPHQRPKSPFQKPFIPVQNTFQNNNNFQPITNLYVKPYDPSYNTNLSNQNNGLIGYNKNILNMRMNHNNNPLPQVQTFSYGMNIVGMNQQKQRGRIF